MKTMRIHLLTLFSLCLLMSVSAFSQGKFKKAEAAFNAGEYHQAVDLYREAFEAVKDKSVKTTILFKIAECYRITNEPRKAEVWYKKVVDKNYNNPLAFLYYADVMKMNGKYADAKEIYKQYKDMVPDDPRGANGIASCDQAQQWTEKPLGYQIENMKFLNSRANDYCPAYASPDYMEIVFTSSRETATGTAIHGATGQKYSDLFWTKLDKQGKWSEPAPMSDKINTEGEEGSPCFNADFSTMYFASCRQSKNKNLGCQIYTSNRKGDDWSVAEEVRLGFADSVVVAHPAISPDELTLYFVSDMPGGQGKADIWMVTRASKNDRWGDPVNLGPEINTPGDEKFPYVHADGTLYFSSNGLPGLGGLDIFRAKKSTDGHWKVENMKVPINSSADDFGIVFQKEEEKGLFSSTRDKKDDDIYSFVLPPLKFNAIIWLKDEKTKKPIEGAKIKAIGSDGTTIESAVGSDGSVRIPLKPSTDYVFVSSVKGYLNGKDRFTTKGQDKSQDYTTTVLMASTAKPIELPNIFYDYGKWDLRPESMIALDKLVETLNDNPTITIELASHTDNRGNDKANMELSQKRAQSVVNYLIEKGITADRLVAKGYGESRPREIDEAIAKQYPFMPAGTVLTEAFINSLTETGQQEIAHQFNRRTEFKVLRNDYIPANN
jgi:peptidoglycan-associated lipoprotein